MAIKSSGQLSLRDDISRELGGPSTNISLEDMALRIRDRRDHRMSEFYGYSGNSHYVEAQGSGYMVTSPVAPPQTGLGNLRDISCGLWIRLTANARRNQELINIGDYRRFDRRGTDDSVIRAYYLGSLNRISIEVWRNGSRVNRRQYPLHDFPNRNITGITSSSTGWRSTQRGNTDGDGFNFLSWTVRLYNGGTATNNIDFYWNGRPLTYSVNNNNTGLFPISNISGQFVSIGETLRATTVPSGVSWFGDIDDAWVIGSDLNPGVHQAIWNAGRGGGVDYFQNNALLPMSYWEFNNDTFTTIGSYDYRLSRFGSTSFVAY